MTESHPKADPQTWANSDHLDRIAHERGLEAATEEIGHMFSPEGKLPPVERRHLEIANSHRRWNDLPLLPVEKYLKASEQPHAAAAGPLSRILHL